MLTASAPVEVAPSPEQELSPSSLHAILRPLLPSYAKEAKEALQRKAKYEWEEAHPGRPYRGEAPPYYSWKYFRDRGQVLKHTHRKSAMRVSLLTYKRAFRLMSELIQRLEHAAFEVSFTEHRERLRAKRGEAYVEIRLTEKLDAGTRFDRINSATQEKEYTKTLTPTGRLSLFFEQQGLGETAVNDTSTIKLEDRWPEVLAAAETRHRGSLNQIASWSQWEVEREEAARVWKERERMRAEAQRRAEAEKAKRAALLHEAQNWQSAELLRRYVAHRAAQHSSMGAEDSDFETWQRWALDVAESLVTSVSTVKSDAAGESEHLDSE